METQGVALPKCYPREGDPSAPHAYYMYFIYCAGRVKIGRAIDVADRVSNRHPLSETVKAALGGMERTMALTEKQRDKRNLSPHAEAIAAMSLWSEDYAFKQRGGSMDFWDSLPTYKKQICRELVKRIQGAKTEEWSTPLVKA